MSRLASGSAFTKWARRDRKSTRLNSSHLVISYAVFCLKKKNTLRHKRIAVVPTLETEPTHTVDCVATGLIRPLESCHASIICATQHYIALLTGPVAYMH